MRKSLLLGILGVCAWLILTLIPVSSAHSPNVRPMSALPSCSVNPQENGQITCSCASGDDLSFEYQRQQLVVQCAS